MPNEIVWISDDELIAKNMELFLEIKRWFYSDKNQILKNPKKMGNYQQYRGHLIKPSRIGEGL